MATFLEDNLSFPWCRFPLFKFTYFMKKISNRHMSYNIHGCFKGVSNSDMYRDWGGLLHFLFLLYFVLSALEDLLSSFEIEFIFYCIGSCMPQFPLPQLLLDEHHFSDDVNFLFLLFIL